jgi:heterodisulfide reductase subunit A-like polyferredoxin
MADLGIANVIARSAFVNKVDEVLCLGCGECLPYCQFDALSLDEVMDVNETRCVGCGVCVSFCPENALGLVRRPADEILPPPDTEPDWLIERAASRGLNLDTVR